ncbi:metallophosphoesterase family protein [Pontibacter sp. 172403-2]|uniref:purple acid phosphatase family protein n=1 Tax=Pontibacter rufus TaxID=2791028 RepID=UPI0018AFEE86|nr:metallophosphoesterase family protein [Pontibacter sp. 172403-2]MBF9254479.1 metallophosphoesterase family protein [Pontibacter sp. 172403-2]
MKRIIFLLGICALLQCIPAFSQVRNIHLSWDSSKEDATGKTMAITWAKDDVSKGAVQYATDSSLSNSHRTQATRAYSDAMQAYIYKATLKHLQPNTTYFYRCGSEEDGWSKIYSFQTAPPLGSQEKFVVGVWGDTQDNEFNTQFEKTEAIVHQMLEYPIQFTIHMGDIVNNGSMATSWRNFFRVAQPLNAIASFMPVTGNHDVVNDTADSGFQKPFPVFHELFNLPEKDTDYSFTYGNTHFVALSSGHAKGVEEAGATNWRYGKSSPEYKWLEADLAKARQNKAITWVIVYMHHPLYSFGWSHVQGWQERIAPLLDRYKVDLALAGHRHVYERHKAIRDNRIIALQDDHVYRSPAGTVYVTNGTAGGSPQGLGGSDMPSMVYTSPKKMYNYAVMIVDGNTITYDVYNLGGERIDYFKIVK